MAITRLTEPEPYVSLEQARGYLQKKNALATASDTTVLEQVIASACLAVTDRIGEVGTFEIEEDIDFCHVPDLGTVGFPTYSPVVSTDTDGVEIRNAKGVFQLTISGATTINVHYVAGRDPVPANIHNATLEMILHVYQESQHLSPASGGSILQSSNLAFQTQWALPIRVRELLGLGRVYTNRPFNA